MMDAKTRAELRAVWRRVDVCRMSADWTRLHDALPSLLADSEALERAKADNAAMMKAIKAAGEMIDAFAIDVPETLSFAAVALREVYYQPHPGDALLAELDRLRSADRWIPCSERLPELSDADRNGNVIAMELPPDDTPHCANIVWRHHFVSWHPLPAAPVAETKKETI